MTHQDRILVAHENDHARRELELLLADHGFRVAAVASCSEALASLERFAPDLVLLSLGADPEPAVACCRQIKSLRETGDVKVVVLSETGDRRAIGRAFNAGCDDYIYRPIDELALLAMLRELLQFTRLRRLLQRRVAV